MTPNRLALGKYYWGIGASLLALLADARLILAPFVLAAQPVGAGWSPGTINDGPRAVS